MDKRSSAAEVQCAPIFKSLAVEAGQSSAHAQEDLSGTCYDESYRSSKLADHQVI